MANEKRLIDANALRDDTFILDAWDAKIVRAWLDDQPTVDAVEVVRCKDCKHLKYGYQCYNPLGISLNNDGDAYVLVDAYDFCSCGERKDNGEEEKDG